MTVNGSVFQVSSYQSFSYSSFRLSAFQATTQASAVDARPAASSSAAKQGADTVTLSPQATASANAAASSGSNATATTDGAAPTDTATSGVPANDRATALFKALDANQDGSVTEDEFKASARALLRRGRERDRAEGAHSEHGHSGGRRLERALERVFDRVDSNGDGALTKDELAAALSSSSRQSDLPTPNLGVSTDQATAPLDKSVDSTAQKATSASNVVSLTVVSIAIRSYTVVGQFGAPNTPAAHSDQLAGTAATPSSTPTDAPAPGKTEARPEQL